MHDSKIIKSTCGKLAAIAMSMLCMAALPSWADTNITEHVKLTEDADWTSLGTVNIAADASIHLNGRNLTVSGFAGDGSIYSSSVLPAAMRCSNTSKQAADSTLTLALRQVHRRVPSRWMRM